MLPDASPDAAGLCLIPPRFGSELGCSVKSTTTQEEPQAEEESVVLARL